jgi:copper chaperone CopZ
MAEVDATTSATIVKPGIEKDTGQLTTYKVEGMECQHCVDTVAQALYDVPGTLGVKVFLSDAKTMISTEADPDFSVYSAAVEKAGYKLAQ